MVDGGSTIDASADLINDVTVSELFRFREKKNSKLETLFGIFFLHYAISKLKPATHSKKLE